MASTNSTQPVNKWALFGFTTTSEERIGPGPPYTSPALQVNLFFRVFLGIISLFVTWVPARLLWRNGEFGGTVLCVMLLVLNLQTVVNALIWRNDNAETWWAGYGLCDIQAYSNFALHTAFNISLFEIMRGLASKVALDRTVKLTRSERRRQRIVSALVIFTFPVIEVILLYFASFGRYNISTLVGCDAVYYPNWIFLVFYILPTPVFAVGAAYMAGESKALGVGKVESS
jgi:pheromone a factor receptor